MGHLTIAGLGLPLIVPLAVALWLAGRASWRAAAQTTGPVTATDLFGPLAAVAALVAWAWPHLVGATRLWIWDDYTYHMVYPALWLQERAIVAPSPSHSFTMQAWYPLSASVVASCSWSRGPARAATRWPGSASPVRSTSARRHRRRRRARAVRLPAGRLVAAAGAARDLAAGRRHGVELLGRRSRAGGDAARQPRARRAARRARDEARARHRRGVRGRAQRARAGREGQRGSS